MAQVHICGTPRTLHGKPLHRGQEIHRHPRDRPRGFRCHRQYLISIGFKPIGQRELIDPADGYVLVLTKKIRFVAARG